MDHTKKIRLHYVKDRYRKDQKRKKPKQTLEKSQACFQTRPCAVEGCPHEANGFSMLCRNHRHRMMTMGHPTLPSVRSAKNAEDIRVFGEMVIAMLSKDEADTRAWQRIKDRLGKTVHDKRLKVDILTMSREAYDMTPKFKARVMSLYILDKLSSSEVIEIYVGAMARMLLLNEFDLGPTSMDTWRIRAGAAPLIRFADTRFEDVFGQTHSWRVTYGVRREYGAYLSGLIEHEFGSKWWKQIFNLPAVAQSNGRVAA